VRGTSEELFFGGMPSYYVDFVVMTFKLIDLTFHFTYIKHFNLVIARASKEPETVDRVPANLVDGIVMSFD
jgi:hypothetical protein